MGDTSEITLDMPVADDAATSRCMTKPQPDAVADKPKRSPKPAADYGICREVDCFLVDLTRRKQRYRKTFGFSTHGGEEGALQAARAWRDALVVAKPAEHQRDVAQRPRRDSKGTPGVSCRRDEHGNPVLWMAYTQIAPGVRLDKAFSVGRYGRMAQKMAIAERARQLQLMPARVRTGSLKVTNEAAEFVQRHAGEPAPITLMVDPDLPPPTDLPPELANKRIKVGYSGVDCCLGRDGMPRSWIARTRIGGKEQCKAFAISTYGYERAIRMAIAERLEQVRRARQENRGVPSSRSNGTQGRR